jgi:hypothetical protein
MEMEMVLIYNQPLQRTTRRTKRYKEETMLDINAVERILDKRYRNGASDNNLIAWLEHLKATSWKNAPKIINGFIDAITQTPSKIEKRNGI